MDNNKEWFLYVVDHHEGPLSIEEIRKLVKKGEARDSSYVWKEGFPDWTMMTDVTEFGPGTPKSDGHGPFAFLTRILPKKKPKTAAGDASATGGVPDAGADLGLAVATGPDLSDVDPSHSCWCLNANKEFSGPYSLKNIIRKMNDGEILVSDSIWKDGWKSFVTISNIQLIMEQVKPEVLANKGERKFKKKAKSVSAAAMGMGKRGDVPKKRLFASRPIQLIFALVALAGIYQSLVLGELDFILEKIPGAKSKVASMHLDSISYGKIAPGLIPMVLGLKNMAMPLVQRYAGSLPEPLKSWISVIDVPETVSPSDAETLREVAVADLKQGVHVATALPVGDEFNPTFLIATNAPDGTVFQVILRGKEGSLLNTVEFEKTISVELNRNLAATPRYMYEGNKPLPKGEYLLIAYESDKQPPEVAKFFAGVPKKKPPAIIPADRVAFVVDSYFLGGKKDANYATRLKEYQEKLKTRIAVEGPELRQIALLLEQMANDSASKFAEISGKLNPKSKATWLQYHTREYAKLSGQLKTVFSKLTPEIKKDYALPNLYAKAEQTYGLTERLHQLEDDVIEKGARADAVPPLAAQTVDAITDLKTLIAKVAK